MIAEITSNDFRGAKDTVVADVEVATRPPMVVADGLQHYVNQGGSELAFEIPGFSRDMVFTLQGLIVLFSGALSQMAAPTLARLWRALRRTRHDVPARSAIDG